MRTLALAFLFCLISTIVNAQVTLQKPIFCNSAVMILEVVRNKYQEKPVWLGTQNQGLIMLLVNETTMSWTLLEISDEVACVLGTGNRFNWLSKYAESL